MSKHWRDLIKTTPALWCIIDSRHSNHVWTTAIAQSRAHPLSVALGEPAPNRSSGTADNSPPSDVDLQLSALAFAEIGRWQDATLRFKGGRAKDLQALAEQEAPLLRSFVLESREISWPISGDGIRLFKGHAPNLRVVELVGVHLNWNGGLLCNLVKLDLTEVVGLSLQQFLNTLQCSPELESLGVSAPRRGLESGILFGLEFGGSGGPRTTLHRLTRLELKNIGAFAEREILNSIDAPHCWSYNIQFESPQARPSALLHLLLFERLSPAVQYSLGNREKLSIDITRDLRQLGDATWIRLNLGGYSFWPHHYSASGMSILIGYVSARAVLVDWMVSAIRVATYVPLVDLHFDGTFSDLGPTGLIELLINLPGLQDLKLEATPNVDSILQALADGGSIGSDGIKSSWLCPRMCTLQLFECTSSDPSILLELVERRAAAAAKLADEGMTGVEDPDLPVRLEILDISGDDCAMDDETFSAIKKLLGHGAWWGRPTSSESEVDGMDTDEDSE